MDYCVVARVFEDDFGLETLIICPKNLVPMWKDYAHEYQGCEPRCCPSVEFLLSWPRLRRYRLVVIDESHNLRNREGRRRYRLRAIFRHVRIRPRCNESKCMLSVGDPVQQDVPRLVQPVAHLRGGRSGPRYPARTTPAIAGRGRVQQAVIKHLPARSRPSTSASTPTTGAT